MAYKEDGNEQFKKRCYKKAIAAYSTGLKEPFKDSELSAILFSNRAAAQYHLGMHSVSLIHPPLLLSALYVVIHGCAYESMQVTTDLLLKMQVSHEKPTLIT